MMLPQASSLRNLYRVGAVAALAAALVFRRNLGVEITMLTAYSPPGTAVGWFTLLQENWLLGLSFLNVFDIVDYMLAGIMFVALHSVLGQANRRYMAVAVSLSFIGIAVYLVSNAAFAMLSLSNQYASATTEAQKSSLLSAGQAVLAQGNPGAIHQGVGGYVSLFLLAAATLVTSAVMLRSNIFSRVTACMGIAAGAFDLAYLVGLVFVPAAGIYLLSAVCIATAGLLLMIWHLLVGVKLYKVSRTWPVKGGGNQ